MTFGRYIYRAYPNKSPLIILEKRERWRIRGLPKIFGYPLLSRERVKLWTSNLASTFTGSIRIKAHKNFGEKGAWTYPWASQIFWVSLVSQKLVKLRTSNFVGTFIGSIGTKAHRKILGIVAVCVVRESLKFSGHPRIGPRAHCAVIFAIAQLSQEVPH